MGEYVRMLRVDHATRRIAGSDDALVDIALETGVADQSHLSRVFKLHTGMLPSEFRSLLRRTIEQCLLHGDDSCGSDCVGYKTESISDGQRL